MLNFYYATFFINSKYLCRQSTKMKYEQLRLNDLNDSTRFALQFIIFIYCIPMRNILNS